MAKTETNVSTLKINRGTYAKVQENLSSITENELIITTDKNVPIPTTNDSGKAVVVNASGEYELGNAGMSQTDADARYLKLAGGTMTGNIRMSNSGYKILTPNGKDALICNDTGPQLGNISTPAQINSSTAVYRSNGNNSYIMLDTSNTQANPTLVGTEAALTGLKLNGTSYKVPTFDPTTISGYDATKVQVLTNNNGTIEWAEASTFAALNSAQYGTPNVTLFAVADGSVLATSDTNEPVAPLEE